jgi:hypothetical protein
VKSAAAVAAALAVTFGAPSSARANGRFPRAERLIEDPRDPNHLILGATYGLVTTADRGGNWYYICEAAFSGLQQYVGDPIVDLGSSGAMIVDVQSSIEVSSDDGCTWSQALGGEGVYVPDYSVARTGNGDILAVFSATEDGSVGAHLADSTDGGKSFQTMGTPLPVGSAFTIDVAPSDASLLYVSALTKTNAAVLLASSDRGATWTSKTIPIGKDELPYIAAIDPADPRKIFLRTSSTNHDNGVPMSNDALFVSADGGDSWREVFRMDAEMLGFALSPDGATVLVGYGDAMDADLLADPTVLGLYRASTSDFSFARLSTTSTTCLAWTKSGIYACTSHIETGYALAFAPASSGPDPAKLAPLLYLGDVRGPACCGAAQAVCADSWATACVTFGACDGGVTASSAGTCTDDGGPKIDAAPGSSSCGCRVGARSTGESAGLGTMSLLALAATLARTLRGRRVSRDVTH